MSYVEANRIYEGDCLEVMRGLPDNCIDTIITDPPYGLKFMGKNWDHGIPGPAYWRECLRVAKPGATLMAFGGTRTYHRLVCAIEDAGWEIRDCITYFHDGNQAEAALMASLDEEQLAAYLELHYPSHQMAWVYGEGFPKSHNVSKAIDKAKGAVREVVGYDEVARGKFAVQRKNGVSNINIRNREKAGEFYKTKASAGFANPDEVGKITAPATPLAAKWDGWGSVLKPAFEPIIVAMAPLDGAYAENAEKWGVAGLNIDGARIPTNGESLIRPVGNGSVNTYEWANRPNPIHGQPTGGETGRYPANVIVSGEPGVEAEFAKAGVKTSTGGTKPHRKPSPITVNGGFKETANRPYFHYQDSGSASRYFQHCPQDAEPARLYYCPKAGPKERATPGNNHPTQKPLSLMRYLAKLTKTPDGGVVLDPFAGSGTTALACISEGRDYILIEKEADYADLCRRRIAEYTGQEIAPKEVRIAKGETTKQLSLW